MFTALFFALRPYFSGLETIKQNPDLYFENLNSMLIFMGLGVSFASLQDITKTQNKLTRKIYEDPKKGRLFILMIILMIGFVLGSGLVGFFSNNDKTINELSVGLIVLGLGMFGFLKAGVEMFEYHRSDKNAAADKR